MSELSVRRFEPADRSRVLELDRASLRTTPEFHPDAPDDDLRDVAGHYFERGGEFLVGETDGEIVAMGAYEPVDGWKRERFPDLVPDAAELTRMRVDPDHFRRGHGRRIYEALERRAREDDRPALVLDTGVDNDRARPFYESLGFALLKEVHVEFGGASFDLAVYRKEL